MLLSYGCSLPVYHNDASNKSINEFYNDLVELNHQYSDEPVNNRLIVKSKKNIPILGGAAIVEGYNDLHIVQFDDNNRAKEALAYYQNDDSIQYVEENFSLSTMDSTSFNYDNHLSWGSDSIGIDDYIDYMEEYNSLPEIVVGVIDTGIDLDHEFLQDRIIPTGFNSSSSGESSSEDDDNGHGSHVSGIIVDNTTSNVKIQGYKCLNENGSGSLSDVILAIYAATENGVNVINMSLGGPGNSSAMQEAVDFALANGITVCVAAGNSGQDASRYCPANANGVITVAAHDAYDKIPMWSNWGNIVDIIAPGESINSCWNDGSYKNASGTSMASPFAAAAASMILTTDKSLMPQHILQQLTDSAREINVDSQLEGKKALFIGVIDNYKERTPKPNFLTEPGIYENTVSVSLSCEDENASIYYTLNGERPNVNNSSVYNGPIQVEEHTTIRAFAVSPGKFKSLVVKGDYKIVSEDDESLFDIDENGVITAYHGNNLYLRIPEYIKGVLVKGLGDNLFKSSDLYYLVIPDSLETVGNYTFRWCNNLTEIDCKNVHSLGEYAFAACTNLEAVYFNGDFTVSKRTFSGCSSLTQIDLSKLLNAEDHSFYDCRNITSLNNSKLTEIKKSAFHYCENMLLVSLTNVTEIGEKSFKGCTFLETAEAPSLQEIGLAAFNNCQHLKEISFPNLTTMSGSSIFAHCCQVERVYLPSLQGSVTSTAFSGNYLLNDMNLGNVTKIENRAFENCMSLTEFVSYTTQEIGDEAFEDCQNLKTVYVPEVTTIGNQAFLNRSGTTLYDIEIMTLFAPKLVTAKDLPVTNSDTKIYLSDKLQSVITYGKEQEATIIAPLDSYAHSFAEDGISNSRYENHMQFVDSDTMVDAIGTHTDENGDAVFEFGWKNIEDVEQYASEIAYTAEGTTVGTTIGRPLEKDGVTYFQVIGENELRGCVDINGMVFRSASLTASENKSEPDNGCAHEWHIFYYIPAENDNIIVFHCSNCNEYYRVRFAEHLNDRDFPLLDLNDDGIVNAKDYAILLKTYISE